MFNLFRKKEVKPTFFQRLMKIKGWLTTITAIVASFVYFYGFVKPDFTSFKKTEVTAVQVGAGLFVQVKSNKIPNVPVTVSFIVDDVVLAHRHYSLGIPSIKGIHFTEGQAEWIEPIPILFQLQNPKLTVRFSFHGLKTLLVPEVITFNTQILDGNQQKKEDSKNKELFYGDI